MVVPAPELGAIQNDASAASEDTPSLCTECCSAKHQHAWLAQKEVLLGCIVHRLVHLRDVQAAISASHVVRAAFVSDLWRIP